MTISMTISACERRRGSSARYNLFPRKSIRSDLRVGVRLVLAFLVRAPRLDFVQYCSNKSSVITCASTSGVYIFAFPVELFRVCCGIIEEGNEIACGHEWGGRTRIYFWYSKNSRPI